jgi:hypothetical protein
LKYNEEDWTKFINVSMEELKQEILDYCGSDWVKHLKDAKSIKDYPISVSTSRMFLKILITDSEDNIIEKVIEFRIPMGC